MFEILLHKKRKQQKKEWTLDELLSNTTKTSGGCLEWKWNKDKNGYGRMWYEGRPGYKVHRLSMKLAGHEIDGWKVLHKCDNPSCINPDHLFLGTSADNIHDAQAKGRFPVAQPKPPKRPMNIPAIHGTKSKYATGCRCVECKAANRKYYNEYRKQAKQTRVKNKKPLEHGTQKAYGRGCRCWKCKDAQSLYTRLRRIREKLASLGII